MTSNKSKGYSVLNDIPVISVKEVKNISAISCGLVPYSSGTPARKTQCHSTFFTRTKIFSIFNFCRKIVSYLPKSFSVDTFSLINCVISSKEFNLKFERFNFRKEALSEIIRIKFHKSNKKILVFKVNTRIFLESFFITHFLKDYYFMQSKYNSATTLFFHAFYIRFFECVYSDFISLIYKQRYHNFGICFNCCWFKSR